MNKPIPEGGRSVKCARCGHQWRLVAETSAAEEEAPGDEEQPQDAVPEQHDPFERAADYVRKARSGIAAAPVETDMEQQASEWLARRDHHAAAISTLSQPEITGYEQPSAPDEAEPEPESAAEVEAEAEAEPMDEDVAEEPQASSGESWWQRLRAKAEPVTEDVPEHFSTSELRAASENTFGADQTAVTAPAEEPDDETEGFGVQANDLSEVKWPEFTARSWHQESPGADEAEPDFEEAEAEIREALRSALENPAEPAPSAFAEGQEAAAASDWRSRWDLGGTDSKADEISVRDAFLTRQNERLPFASRFEAEPEDEEREEPFKLTGARPKFPVYGTRDDDQADDTEQDEHARPQKHAFEDDIEDAFRSAGLPKRPAKAEIGAFDEQGPASDFGNAFNERFAHTGEDGDLGESFDDDDAAPQARLESTDLAAYERSRSYGGLAIAAAWAVFLSIVSGIALAFVSFRQDIMAALPGTRSLYHNLGFAVADNSVDFGDVSYRWTTVEGKPMIEVTGQVVNVSERTVKVPRVRINLRDGARRDPVQATASVQAELLAPRESTNFTLEFASPSKDVSQIELEFDHSQGQGTSR